MAKKPLPVRPEYKLAVQYYETFSGESGRAVLKHMRQIYLDRLSYLGGDPYETAYREGQRSVILDILTTLKSSKNPELFDLDEGEYEY